MEPSATELPLLGLGTLDTAFSERMKPLAAPSSPMRAHGGHRRNASTMELGQSAIGSPSVPPLSRPKHARSLSDTSMLYSPTTGSPSVAHDVYSDRFGMFILFVCILTCGLVFLAQRVSIGE